MNKIAILVGGIIVVAAVIGGLVYMSRGSAVDSNATTTPSIATGDTGGTVANSPQAGVPTVVTSSNVSPTNTTAIVNGNVNPKGAFTSYWYEFGTSSDLGNKTTNQTLGSGFVQISAPGYITGLLKNTTYYFRLVGENKYGRVAGTIYSFSTSENNPAPVGSAPISKTIAASGISRTTANLNGEVTPNKSFTSVWFEYGKTADLGNTTAFSSVGDGSSKLTTSVSLSGLDPLTTYYFRLNAQNQFGTINGSILNFKTTGPTSAKAPSVTTGNASAISDSGATLHGTVNPNLADTTYWFECSTDSLLGSVLLQSTDPVSLGAGSSPMSVDAAITDLNSKTNYYFRLVAQNSLGTVRGDKVTFKTK